MNKKPSSTDIGQLIERPPVVVVMGHIDHGKTTLLDYIRKTKVVDKESGGITQHTSAYEFETTDKEKKLRKITFLDTPGHEAFGAMRARGAHIADIAILVVSAEDGVKPQTLDAYKAIEKAGIPFVVAINKIDRPNANVDRTKMSLAEHSILVEGFGGEIPFAAISAKTGEGVDDLLDVLFLVADLQELRAHSNAKGEGVIIEAHMDSKKGATATIIVLDGVFRQGEAVVSEECYAPLRIMESFLGKPVKEATFSSPLRISGWSSMPAVGSRVTSTSTKREAEEEALKNKKTPRPQASQDTESSLEDTAVVPVILKSDVVGTLEGIEHELKKIAIDRVILKIVSKGNGDITENDVKLLTGGSGGIILGFKVHPDQRAKDLAERQHITIQTFDIIYELTEWLSKELQHRRPRKEVEKILGEIRVLRTFSQQKEKQVLGGKVVSGTIKVGDRIKIHRRDAEIGEGKVLELQQQKISAKEITEGNEFGALIESKHLIAERDTLNVVKKVIE